MQFFLPHNAERSYATVCRPSVYDVQVP